MQMKELEKLLTEARSKLRDLQVKYDSALSENQSAIQRDLHREDGSSRQDALHEQLMQSCKDDVDFSRKELDKQKEVVSSLELKLSEEAL